MLIRILFLLLITIHLAWDGSPEATGYKLHYGTESRKYTVIVDVGNVTDYILENVDETKPMFFAATAYNASDESDYSEEIEATTDHQKMAGKNNRITTISVENGKAANPVVKTLPTITGLE